MTGTTVAKPVGSFSASRPPSVSRHLISVFPIFLFRSVSLGPPARPTSVFTSSPPFLFVFRGDRGPETDVRAVKNGRRCASGTGTFSSPPLPLSLHAVPCSEFYYWHPRSTRNAFHPTDLHGAHSALYHYPVRLWPSTRVRTMTIWHNVLRVSLTSRKPSVLS